MTLTIRFQRQHLDNPKSTWNKPKDVAERLAELNIKTQLAANSTPISAQDLLKLSSNDLKSKYGLDYQDLWRFLDDVALAENTDEIVDLQPTSNLRSTLALGDGYDRDYASPMQAVSTAQGRLPPTDIRTSDLGVARSRGTTQAWVIENKVSLQPYGNNISENDCQDWGSRLGQFLFEKRQSTLRSLFALEREADLVDAIQKAIGSELPPLNKSSKENLAKFAVETIEKLLADTSTTWDDVPVLADITSLDLQDQMLQLGGLEFIPSISSNALAGLISSKNGTALILELLNNANNQGEAADPIHLPAFSSAKEFWDAAFLQDDSQSQASKIIRGVLASPNTNDAFLVRLGQRLLKLQGVDCKEDGIFGPALQENLRRFQEKEGLPITGTFDAATLLILSGRAAQAGIVPSLLSMDAPISGNSEGGSWTATSDWKPQDIDDLAKFAEIVKGVRAYNHEPCDAGMISAEILVLFARARGLPLNAKIMGRGAAQDLALHNNSNPLEATRAFLKPLSDATAKAHYQFYFNNANGNPGYDCLNTFNRGIREIFGSYKPPRLGSTVDESIQKLQQNNPLYAGPTVRLGFLDENGRPTTGATKPEKLRKGESVANTILSKAGNVPGWNFFGYSILDGVHSIMIVCDNRDLQNPRLYWCDQWDSHQGWYPLTPEKLDADVEHYTSLFWDRMLEDKGVKFKCESRVTQLLPPGSSTSVMGFALSTSAENEQKVLATQDPEQIKLETFLATGKLSEKSRKNLETFARTGHYTGQAKTHLEHCLKDAPNPSSFVSDVEEYLKTGKLNAKLRQLLEASANL